MTHPGTRRSQSNRWHTLTDYVNEATRKGLLIDGQEDSKRTVSSLGGVQEQVLRRQEERVIAGAQSELNCGRGLFQPQQ